MTVMFRARPEKIRQTKRTYVEKFKSFMTFKGVKTKNRKWEGGPKRLGHRW